MIFFCLVRVACQTVSVFYFPITEVATCSPRLPIFYLLTYVNFLHFRDNDDRMSSKRRNLSALVFLINSTTIFNLIRILVLVHKSCHLGHFSFLASLICSFYFIAS